MGVSKFGTFFTLESKSLCGVLRGKNHYKTPEGTENTIFLMKNLIGRVWGRQYDFETPEWWIMQGLVTKHSQEDPQQENLQSERGKNKGEQNKNRQGEVLCAGIYIGYKPTWLFTSQYVIMYGKRKPRDGGAHHENNSGVTDYRRN